jgi:hypothetical protein
MGDAIRSAIQGHFQKPGDLGMGGDAGVPGVGGFDDSPQHVRRHDRIGGAPTSGGITVPLLISPSTSSARSITTSRLASKSSMEGMAVISGTMPLSFG